jgi:osmotically-inducible protein OsmY
MKRPEQNRSNYGVNPQGRNQSMVTGKGINRDNFNRDYDQYSSGTRSSDWTNPDEHFSFDHDNNFDQSSKYNDYSSSMNDKNRGGMESSGYNSNHKTDFDDEGLETRSHRMKFTGRDRAGMRSSNPGMQGQNFGSYGYSESYDDDIGQKSNRMGHYGKGPKGYRRSDEKIKEDVCEALYAHTEIDASDVEVSVKEGLVVLSGTVESRDIKRRVEVEIENLSGVDDVQNDLRVAKVSGTGSSTSSFRNTKLA